MPRVSTLNYQSACHQQIQHLRLLSLLNSSFSEQQESSLQDYVETSIITSTELYLYIVSYYKCVSNVFCGSFCA